MSDNTRRLTPARRETESCDSSPRKWRIRIAISLRKSACLSRIRQSSLHDEDQLSKRMLDYNLHIKTQKMQEDTKRRELQPIALPVFRRFKRRVEPNRRLARHIGCRIF